MRKHIYLMLIILMPIFAQKSKWKIAESKQIVVPEKSVNEPNSTSVPRRISVSYTHLTLPTSYAV